jgi:hypothetical protein
MNGLGGHNLAGGVANVGIARKGVSIDSDLSSNREPVEQINVD